MIKENIRVVNSTGLHARPAAALIKAIKKYESSVTLVNGEKTVILKGLMSVLGAGVKGNSNIDIIVDGADELDAMSEIKGLFANGFGEKE
ncbi:phosphocarrier protein [Pantoea agglomerans]|uniref:HPr family phosphocarrier protein n=1 Tax=Enterobacter agglomerans TaxID=549 RepID=UPI0015FAAF85|nr:HPr family phosphocarrier protein [Pantoea agglomerans]MBA8867089.1 phosphocarrier protein [Pantoea agglomerans]MBA8894153.1 phosphocarrier protein [Pantoea agglomerans]